MQSVVQGPGSMSGRVALVTGSSRGIGADTIRLFARAGAKVVVNYRDKAARAEALVSELTAAGAEAVAVRADLTDPGSVETMFATVGERFGRLDLLVLNASGGMEKGADEDYAMRLNRDAQVAVVDRALPLLRPGSRIVFVTSHQAHFVATTAQLPEYAPVARSKRAGEDALRARIPEFTRAGIGFVVVSGDMIEGTITAKLLERANPGALEERRSDAGRLYTVGEFAAEVAAAAVGPVPADHTILVGNPRGFLGS